MKPLAIFSDQEFAVVSTRLNHLAQLKADSLREQELQELKNLTLAVAQYQKRKKLIGLFCTNEMLWAR